MYSQSLTKAPRQINGKRKVISINSAGITTPLSRKKGLTTPISHNSQKLISDES